MKERVKRILKEQGRTMKDLAELLGIDAGSLSRAMSGNPTLSTLQAIAKALGVELYELFTDRRIKDAEPDNGLHGAIWTNGSPNIINSMKDLEDLLILAKMGQPQS